MIFFNFFAILLVILYSRYCRNENRNEFFFISFLAYLSLVWIEILPEWCFLIFWILLLFFLEFLAWVGWDWNSVQNLFSLFLSLSQFGLDRNKVRMVFFTFLNFFAIFWGVFYPGSGWKGIQNGIFFSLFLRRSKPGLDRNNARMIFFFFNFLNFFAIFMGVLYPG